jgi:hypothetical protein
VKQGSDVACPFGVCTILPLTKFPGRAKCAESALTVGSRKLLRWLQKVGFGKNQSLSVDDRYRPILPT